MYCTLLSNNLSSKNSTTMGEQMQISWAHLVKHYAVSSQCIVTWRPTHQIFTGPPFLQFSNAPHYWISLDYSSIGVYWRDLGGESHPCPLLLWKADSVGTGKWPAPAAAPPQMCNQATGQLWGLWGGCISKQQGNRYLLFPHSWFFIHIFTRVGGTAKILFLDSNMMVGAESLL